MRILLPLLALFAGVATLAALPKDCNVLLTLEGAIARDAGAAAPLMLEIPVRNGLWPATCWGSAHVNRAHTEGRVTKAEAIGATVKLTVEASVGSDPWVKGGAGVYNIEITEKDGVITGTFTGHYAAQDKAIFTPVKRADGWTPLFPPEKPVFKALFEADVKGAVSGSVGKAWPGVVPGVKPPAPGEHPRLIFRKADLAKLKTNAETPEGKAIMAQFWKVIDKEQPGDGKYSSWDAIGHGFAYQMTGEQKYADKARTMIEDEFFKRPAAGGQDIHHAPRAQGLAIVFDLCYDGWDAAFRAKCVDELQQRALELITARFNGGGMGGANLAVWSNHNGIRVSGAGLAALAVLGEKNSEGKVMDCAALIAEQAAREARGFLTLGQGGGYYHMEGCFYKGMTYRRGLLPFLLAYRTALGLQVQTPGMADWSAAGYFLEGQPGQVFPRDEVAADAGTVGVDVETLGDIIWTQGWIVTPDHLLPGMKWLNDRAVGLNGNKTFGVPYPYLAPYLMATYPFATPASDPAVSYPWVSPDPYMGHYVFRPLIKDKDDILVVTNLKSNTKASCHYERTGVAALLNVRGLGKTWIDGRFLPEIKGQPTWKNDLFGAVVTDQQFPAGKVAILNMSLDRGFRDEAPKGYAGATVRVPEGPGAFIDRGVRGTRSMVVDCSGKSGAPLLIAVYDVLTDKDGKPLPLTWKLPIAAGAGAIAVNGAHFTVGDGLTGMMVSGQTPSAQLAADCNGTAFAVFTLTKGPAPAITADAKGDRVTVGDRTIRAKDGTLTLE
jgi:hypothetical protein